MAARSLTKKEDIREDLSIARTQVEYWENMCDPKRAERRCAEPRQKIAVEQAKIDAIMEHHARAATEHAVWTDKLAKLRQKLALEENKGSVAKLKDVSTKIAEIQAMLDADPELAAAMAALQAVPT